MKFFLKKQIKYVNTVKKKNTNLFKGNGTEEFCNILKNLNGFILKGGCFSKKGVLLTHVFKNIDYFIYNNLPFLKTNYADLRWFLENFVEKKLNSLYIFENVVSLIKPPFIIKAVSLPKKLKKKTKQKFLIKIVYKNENKRVKSSHKQLYHYSGKFLDRKFDVRLYKAIMFSFLD